MQNAFSPAMRAPTPAKRNPRVLYPLASFLYRASLMMAMNRIANSDGSSGPSREAGLEGSGSRIGSRRMTRNGALSLGGSINAEHRALAATLSPKSAAQQILIHGTAIKSSRITPKIIHLQISNRRQTAPFSRAPRAQKRESHESQSAR